MSVLNTELAANNPKDTVVKKGNMKVLVKPLNKNCSIRKLSSSNFCYVLQAPAQRPDEVAYQPNVQQPQLSFRSPSGQFSPVSSSSSVSLPSAPQGIAYYLPNQNPSPSPANYPANDYSSPPNPPQSYNRKPPVLLIGNFPPRPPAESPQPATFPYIPTTPAPLVSRYSPPNPVTVGSFATPSPEEYGGSFSCST